MTKKAMKTLVGLSGITLSILFSSQHIVFAEEIDNSESTTQLLQPFVQVVSSEAVDYPATIISENDGINSKPWGTQGYQTIGYSSAYLGADVIVTQEQVTDNGVTWAHILLNGEELGWVAKEALSVRDYVQILSTVDAEYPAIVIGMADHINTLPWGTKGYQTVGIGADYLGYFVNVTQEKVADNGVTWAKVDSNGEELGWIAKSGLSIQAYNQVLKSEEVDYPAIISRKGDGINTLPWGVSNYQTIGYSDHYLEAMATVTREQTLDNGVTWALISIDGEEVGWIAKDALTVQKYAQITSSKSVDYPAIIARETDGINTLPWGTKGSETIGYSYDYLDQDVIVKQEQVLDNGVTWAQIFLDGKEVGWIAKEALDTREYVRVVSSAAVAYKATIISEMDGVNTQPWGTKGYATIGYSSDYRWKEVTVTQEKVTNNGVTWALVSIAGKDIGWISKEAFYAHAISTTNTLYRAIISRETDGINTLPWGINGFQTIANSSDYLWKEVVVSQEQETDTGVTWALIYLDGKRLGWITKAALTQVFASDVPLVTNFVNSIAPIANNLCSNYGLYTSVMIAQAALESSWGRSILATAPNYNLFGIKGDYNGESVMIATKEYVSSTGTWITTNAEFQKYPSHLESLQANASKLANGVYWDPEYYKGTWRINTSSYKDATAWLTGRYATDPSYNSKLNSIIEAYSLWVYDVYD